MAKAGRNSMGFFVFRCLSWPPALVLLALLAFAPALRAGFVYDDRRDVLANPAAQAETFLDRVPQTLRPLLKASYALQDALTGPDPLAFHAVNLGLHLGSVLLVFALLARAGRATGLDPVAADRLAGLATAVWAVHPALAETVAYVSGRSMGLSTALMLGCLLAATAERPRLGLAGLLALLAPLARETALVAPLVLLAWQVTVAPEPPRAALRRAAPVWLGAVLAALVIATMARHRELVGFSLDQRGPLDALRGNLFAVTEILRLWLQPWRISVLPAQPVTQGWTDVATLWRLGVLAGVPLMALVLRRRAPLAALAVLWALLALLPTNSLIWRMDPVALRPLYLAGIGPSLLLALGLFRLRWAGSVTAAALALWLGQQAWERASLYQDEVALFADAARKAPDDARTHLLLGLVLANAGRVTEARAALATALAVDPFLTPAQNALRLLDASEGVYRGGP